MKMLLSLLVAVALAGCSTITKEVTLTPTAVLKIDPRLLKDQTKFSPRESTTLTEAELLMEYSILSTAYAQCYYDNKALTDLIKQELSPK